MQFTCVTCSLRVKTGKFTRIYAASTSSRIHANCLQLQIILSEYKEYFTSKNTRGAHANLPATSFAGKNTCNWQARTYKIARKMTCNWQAKTPEIAGNTAIIQRVKSPASCKLDWILQVKLTANCVLNYEWSRWFCVRFLPRKNRWVHLFLQVNYIRGLFTCVSPHAKFPTFAGNATMSIKLLLVPGKLQWNTLLHKKNSCLEMLK